jgi:hypothetical protein
MLWAPAVDDGCRFGSYFRRRASEPSKTRVAVELNYFLCYFIDLYKTPLKPNRPQPAPLDGCPRIGLGRFIELTP